MKFSSYLCFILLIMPIESKSVGNEEVLLGIEDSSSKVNWKVMKEENKVKNESITLNKVYVKSGNISNNLRRRKELMTGSSVSKPIIYPELAKLNKSGVDIGDIFDCIIKQDIKAYVGSISPILAEVINGPFQGLQFVGNATMDPKTKDIVVEFSKIRDLSNNVKHELKATLHSSTGEVGLKGTFNSKYWQYFFATVLSRTAEGYAQATVQQDRNIFGNYQTIPNTENAGKSAVAEAASSTASLVSDRLKNLPEFVTKKGPIKTKIFIIETPSLIN